jgi:hypothetical protein
VIVEVSVEDGVEVWVGSGIGVKVFDGNWILVALASGDLEGSLGVIGAVVVQAARRVDSTNSAIVLIFIFISSHRLFSNHGNGQITQLLEWRFNAIELCIGAYLDSTTIHKKDGINNGYVPLIRTQNCLALYM